MPAFALVTEGITDQAVIEAVLAGWFESRYAEALVVNPLQPLRDATDETTSSTSGWERVIEYCSSDQFVDALAFNDFIVVQIDSDQGDHPNFGVSLTENGVDRPVEDIVEGIILRIEAALGEGVCSKYADRIIYAVAVHSIECWLFALYANQNQKERTKSCFKHLQKILSRKNIGIEKCYADYRRLSRPFRSIKKVCESANNCESLRYFLYMLQIVA